MTDTQRQLAGEFYRDPMVTLLQGDVREVLRELGEGSVQMAVTSPPYWSLRDYGVEPSVWGGETECVHEWGDVPIVTVGRNDTNRETPGGRGGSFRGGPRECHGGAFCRCGAWMGALGLEPTPEMFVAHMVEVFREVRRVLRDDATVWLNIGDSYAGAPVGTFNGGGFKDSSAASGGRDLSGIALGSRQTKVVSGLKPKDLVGIPWMLAFALRADGWWLRQEIIWHKPNPMPESVTDRCTKAHESLFLLAKSARYYYDADAIRESAEMTPQRRRTVSPIRKGVPGQLDHSGEKLLRCEPAQEYDSRNKRSVWTIPTAPFAKAHFATFPPALVEPCVLAGSREGDVVLDPFAGSGTTAMVAKRLGRRSIGIDLNPEYLAMAVKRVRAVSLSLGVGS